MENMKRVFLTFLWSVHIIPMKEHTREIYNLKNIEGQIKFKRLTEDTQDFLINMEILQE